MRYWERASYSPRNVFLFLSVAVPASLTFMAPSGHGPTSLPNSPIIHKGPVGLGELVIIVTCIAAALAGTVFMFRPVIAQRTTRVQAACLSAAGSILAYEVYLVVRHLLFGGGS